MKSVIYGFLALILGGIVVAGAYAMPFGRWMQGNNGISEALESGDYDAYLAAVDNGNRPDSQVLTDEEFSQRSEQYQEMAQQREKVQAALDSGDYGAWRQAKSARFTQDRFNMLVQDQMQYQAVQQALEDHDYDAWISAIEGTPMADRLTQVIDEGNFDTYVQLHDAVQDNDLEAARELQSELGLNHFQAGPGMPMGHERGRFSFIRAG